MPRLPAALNNQSNARMSGRLLWRLVLMQPVSCLKQHAIAGSHVLVVCCYITGYVKLVLAQFGPFEIGHNQRHYVLDHRGVH